ncbi:MAG: hypothetical protein KF851_05550 [Pirellulaceae bacterium]|nr:hypothetical protein [Pirellulaceae bacterium]
MDDAVPAFNIDPKLFWDTDATKVDPERHASYVIERVVTRGQWEDWKNLVAFYGKERIKQVVIGLRYLDPKTHHFLAFYFNVPLESFRCYTEMSLNQGHWIY